MNCAEHAVQQTKNDEPRWGPDGGQKRATGPKAQALRAPRSDDSPFLFLLLSPLFPPPFSPPSRPLSRPIRTRTRHDVCMCAQRMHSAASASTSASPASRWRGLGSLRSLERETSRRRTCNRGLFIRLIIHITPACPKLISLTPILRERKNTMI